ncbi:hypothetical protein D9M71_771440 [compost metagenome]
MHLQDHPGIQPALAQPVIYLDHGPLDDVGSSTLHRGVDRRALGALAQGRVLGIDVWQVQPAAKQGFDKALLGRLGAGALHIGQHARVAGKITVDVVL